MKAPKESLFREAEGEVASYRCRSYIKRKPMRSGLRICKVFWCAPKNFGLFGQKAYFRKTAPMNTKWWKTFRNNEITLTNEVLNESSCTSYLFNAKQNWKNLIFGQKTVFDATKMAIKYLKKNMNISGNSEPSSTNLVLNESLWY